MALPDHKLAFHIDEAREAGAGSRSEIYEALRRGDLKAKKRGRRTVILRDDLAEYLASLPDYASEAAA
ncbi:helix-turn-helix domain-containing protein [Tsuneonella sp. SYSU-LHT278]|uniref:helix-turn-helix domain-containing protein n=1 Tax=Tsuneonella sediminis TaxID=3416089 RepID=UPI003F79A6A4